MLKGFAAYVLPCFENYIYITIDEGDMFGHVDFVMHKLALEIEIMGEKVFKFKFPLINCKAKFFKISHFTF